MKLQVFLLFFLASCNYVSAVHNEQLFVQANQLFEQQQYVQASDIYQMLDCKGFFVFYNMGLAYLHQNKISQALVCFKRAEKQANFRQLTQLYELFAWMEKQKNSEYALGWFDQLAIFSKKCILSISMLCVQVLLFILILLFMICWYKRWYRLHIKQLLWMTVVGIVLFIIWYYKCSMFEQQTGIIVKNIVTVFAGPDISFYKKAEFHESDEVVVINKQQGYYQVRTKEIIGWISDKDVELV